MLYLASSSLTTFLPMENLVNARPGIDNRVRRKIGIFDRSENSSNGVKLFVSCGLRFL